MPAGPVREEEHKSTQDKPFSTQSFTGSKTSGDGLALKNLEQIGVGAQNGHRLTLLGMLKPRPPTSDNSIGRFKAQDMASCFIAGCGR